MATRTGQIHDFSENSPWTAAQFIKANSVPRKIPVVVRSLDEKQGVIGKGWLGKTKVDGNDLIGDIKWSDDVEKLVGKSPIARCEFDKSGVLTRIVVEPECECDECQAGGTCEDHDHDHDAQFNLESETEPKPKKKPMATRTFDAAVEATYEKNLAKYDDDPEIVAKAAIRQLAKMKEMLPADDHVALPKGDADALAAYRAIDADPANLRKTVETLVAYQAIDPDPKNLKTMVSELPTLREQVTAREQAEAARTRNEILTEVATSLGYQPNVFLKTVVANPEYLPAGAEFVEVKRRGAKGEYASYDVKYKDKDGKESTTPIEEFEAETWSDLMPALRPTAPLGLARRTVATPAPSRPAPLPATGLRETRVANGRFQIDRGNRTQPIWEAAMSEVSSRTFGS